jgi:hypothetical protein
MANELFAHGMSRIDMVGGMVRFELFTLEPPVGESKTQVIVPTQAVIMPMEGFLRAFGIQENMVQQLIKAGVLARRDDEAAAVPPPPTTSPNFG